MRSDNTTPLRARNAHLTSTQVALPRGPPGFLEAVKALAQARIDQIKEGSKQSKLKRIEVK